MIVTTGRYIVELKEPSWWNMQEIQSILASGAKMRGSDVSGFDGAVLLDATAKAFEGSIQSIKEGETSIQFSQEWMNGLTQEEGATIKEAIDELGKKK
jgi:hypothetical protein